MFYFIFILFLLGAGAELTDTEECNRYLDENIDGIKRVVTYVLFRSESKGCVPMFWVTDTGFTEKRECNMRDIVFASKCECDFDVNVGGAGGPSVFNKTGSNTWLVKSIVVDDMDECVTTVDVIEGKRGYSKEYTCRLGQWIFMTSKCECSFIVDSDSECEFANAFLIPHINISVNPVECHYDPPIIIGYHSTFQWPDAPFIDPFIDVEEEEDEAEDEEDEAEDKAEEEDEEDE